MIVALTSHLPPRSNAIDEIVEKIVEDVVHELNADQHDNRRKIETADRRNDLAHTAKQRVGQCIEHMYDLAHQMVRGIENAKGNQPTRDHGGDDDEGVKTKNRVDQPDQRVEKDRGHCSGPHLLSRCTQYELVAVGPSHSKRRLDTGRYTQRLW